MDNDKVRQLLALRKQLLDLKPKNNSSIPTTNLTSPEEYEQMPSDLKKMVVDSATQDIEPLMYPVWLGSNQDKAKNALKLTHDVAMDQNAEDYENYKNEGLKEDYLNPKIGELAPVLDPQRFEKIKNMLRSRK